MALFRKRRTIKRCRALRAYVQGIGEAQVKQMSEFLLADKRNTIVVNRQFIMFVTAAGAVAFSAPILPTGRAFDTITLSSSWAKLMGTANDGTYSGTSDSGGGSFDDYDDDADVYTNNNNNNNNNNG